MSVKRASITKYRQYHAEGSARDPVKESKFGGRNIGREPSMDRKHTFDIGYFIFALVLLDLFQVWSASREVVQRSYSDLMQMVDQERAAAVTITKFTIQDQFEELTDRAAEERIYGEVSTGAADDLAKSTDSAAKGLLGVHLSDLKAGG